MRGGERRGRLRKESDVGFVSQAVGPSHLPLLPTSTPSSDLRGREP